MKPIAEYWKNAARDWHASSYEGHATERSVVEWAATFVRSHIRRRHATAVRMLEPHVSGRTVVELGCGIGSLSLALVDAGAGRTLGIDISPDVVELAQSRARDLGVGDRVQFVAGLVEDADPAWRPDILTGLGILEYLEPAGVQSVLRKLKPRYVLFAFDERRVTALTMMHAVYRTLRRLPFYQKYSELEIRDVMERGGVTTPRVFRESGNSFVTNLPATPYGSQT